MQTLNQTQATIVGGGDLDGNAGEQEARNFMRQVADGTHRLCNDLGWSLNGQQLELCITIRPSTQPSGS